MQKVLSPAPNTLYSPNWPALKSKPLAHGLVLELQAQRARVDGLVDHLGDGGEERLVDVHDAASSGSAAASPGRRAAMSIACRISTRSWPAWQTRVQRPQPVQSTSPNLSG